MNWSRSERISTAIQRLILGTRGSPLARAQTQEVQAQLQQRWPHLRVEIKRMKTQGDIESRLDPAQLDKGAFTKTIEDALLKGEVDVAVHSLKDLPTTCPSGLAVGGVLSRADARDALVSPNASSLEQLPQGARVGTGSPRRRAQLLAIRADLNVLPIRGNVETRLQQLDDGKYDALILAAAGLIRLRLRSRITAYLECAQMVPAPGQGAIALEIRKGDERVGRWIEAIDHSASHQAVRAERAFLNALGGGCQLPIAAYANVQAQHINLTGLVANSDGKRVLRDQLDGFAKEAEALGERLAERMYLQGAKELLQ